ncbi:MAG: Stk1 family PASTA domain-containing Ser/Thr kinase [Jatrophihabitans sp.]|nr:MAG: Stk1 family PASTA domain-containing Ser/Thr kinase [Jatrophihabitans sp.]
MQTATADPLVGRTLEGRYRVTSRIARGGMSTVYAAVDERLDRDVAVKVMSAALSADPAFTDRFAREARTAARLTHLNAVAVYDQGQDVSGGERHVFLVMELVEGRTLRELIRERLASGERAGAGTGPFSPAEALSILQPVLAALSAAHRAGIVHRDVKPENILLSDDGVVKVADFGLARAVDADPSSTRTGLMMGTVAYCSPEQITSGSADPRSDVYAAGIVLFELLTGRPPFHGDTAMNIAYQHVHHRVPAPSSRVRGVPEQVDDLVIRATDPDPGERPADAAEFLGEIGDVRRDLDLPAVAIPARARTQRRPRDPRPDTPTGLIGATAATAAIAEPIGAGPGEDGLATQVVDRGTGSGRRDTKPVSGRGAPPPAVVIPPGQREREARRRRRRRGLIILIIVLLLGAGAGFAGWWFAAGRYSQVPDVGGRSLAAAQQQLRDAGYRPGSVTRAWSETVPADEIISTTPGIGSRVERGKTVDLTVSLGKHRIAIPDVSAQSGQAAVAALRGRGLTGATVKERSDDTVPKGQVIGTDPAAGTSVKPDAPITVWVSSGPPIIAVPQINAGTPWTQAQQTLKNAHLNPVEQLAYSDTIPKDTVIALDPADQQVKFGNVTVTVSQGPEFVTIPDVRKQSSESASAQLTALGLVVKLDTSFDGGLFNQVAGVRADGINGSAIGQKVHVGTTVTLIVV